MLSLNLLALLNLNNKCLNFITMYILMDLKILVNLKEIAAQIQILYQ